MRHSKNAVVISENDNADSRTHLRPSTSNDFSVKHEQTMTSEGSAPLNLPEVSSGRYCLPGCPELRCAYLLLTAIPELSLRSHNWCDR
jgi:hypothetical protein